MPKRLDITGQRYGRLIALEFVGKQRCRSKKLYQTKTLWRFRCDCGNVVIRRIGQVRNGDVRSCGCLQKEWRQHQFRKCKTLKRGESSFNGLYKRYQHHAKKSNRKWEIGQELFRKLTKSNCFYCGTAPYQSFKSNTHSNGSYIYMGLDRMDNKEGYCPGNVVPCCMDCNRAKNTLGKTEFLSLIVRIYSHLRRKPNEFGNRSVKREIINRTQGNLFE